MPKAAESPVVQNAACCASPALRPLIGYLQTLTHRADLAILTHHLQSLNITRDDVEPACCFGARSYKRNVIAASPWFELLALTWRSGQCTPIHDHRGVSCAFRVVHGVGTEIRFELTPSGMICPVQTVRMQPGYVCAADDADIHQVANMQAPGEDLITLHIYSPRISKMNTYAFKVSEGCDGSNPYAPGPSEG